MRPFTRAWAILALWAPPVVLGGLALWEIWVDQLFEPRAFYAPTLVNTAGVLIMAAGLTVRQRAPVLCLVAVMADGVLEWAYTPGGSVGVSAEWFVAMLLAFYSVGAYLELDRAAIWLAAALPVFIVLNVIDVARTDQTIGEVISVYPFIFVLWGAGVAVRRFRNRAGELEVLADLLARERDERAIAAATEERARIARELHDVVAHSVSTMVLQAAGARQVIRSHPAKAEDALRSVETTGRQALQELRRLLGILRRDEAPRLDPQPGLSDVEPLVRQMQDAGLPVELEMAGVPPALSPGVDLAAFRIVQEALTNVLKHVGRVETHVRVSLDGDALELDIRNAPGKHGASNGKAGHGLIGIRERAALYGGTVRVGPDPEGGFLVHARLPVEVGRA